MLAKPIPRDGSAGDNQCSLRFFPVFPDRKLEGMSPTRTVRLGSSLALPATASTGTSAYPLRDAALRGRVLLPWQPRRCGTPRYAGAGRQHRKHRPGGENRNQRGRLGPETIGPTLTERTGRCAHPSPCGGALIAPRRFLTWLLNQRQLAHTPHLLRFTIDGDRPDAFPDNAVSIGTLTDGVTARPAASIASPFPTPACLPGAFSLGKVRPAPCSFNRYFPWHCLILDVVRSPPDGVNWASAAQSLGPSAARLLPGTSVGVGTGGAQRQSPAAPQKEYGGVKPQAYVLTYSNIDGGVNHDDNHVGNRHSVSANHKNRI